MCSAGATGGSRRAASFDAVLVPPVIVNTPARLAGEQIRFHRRHWRLAA